MTQNDVNRFFEMLSILKGCYPHYETTEPEFRATSLMYFKALKDLDLEAIGRVMMLAATTDYYPDRFPTHGQIRRLVEDTVMREQRDGPRQAEADREAASDARTRSRYNTLPGGLGRQTYIDNGDGKYERLAREMETETVESGRDPAKQAPDEVTTKWQQKINTLWDDDGSEQTAGNAGAGEHHGN